MLYKMKCRKDGYCLLWDSDNKKLIREHIQIVKDAGIEIPKGYHVHHINGVRDDNRLENLKVLSP